MRFFSAIVWFAVLGADVTVNAEVRALWVTRWDYKTRDDVVAIVKNTAQYGFNHILFQVRGNATVGYPSDVEPWAWRLTGDSPKTTGRNPGWDPLDLAVREAHAHGLSIHAYLNVLPGWRGIEDPPKTSGQLWSVHPEWFMVDAAGQRMKPYETWYAFLSPHHPQVREHLKKVFAEVASRYDIDGIHLDYYRFPADYEAEQVYPSAGRSELAKHRDFSYDQFALKEFRGQTGKSPQEAPEVWDAFRRETLTSLLREIRKTVMNEKSRLVLSCAVVTDPEKAENLYFQESYEWLKDELLDLAFPMNYSRTSFDENLEAYLSAVGPRCVGRVVMGLSATHPAKELERQAQLTREQRAAGIAVFAYSSLFRNHVPTKKAAAIKAVLNKP